MSARSTHDPVHASGSAPTHQNGFVFLGVERVAKRIQLRRHRAEEVIRKLRRAGDTCAFNQLP